MDVNNQLFLALLSEEYGGATRCSLTGSDRRRMRRREFITMVGGSIVWPLIARAQQPGKTYRVGLLATGGVFGALDERRSSILEGLAANGFFEGRNLVFDVRWGEGRYERLSEYAAALASSVDAIVTWLSRRCGGKGVGKRRPHHRYRCGRSGRDWFGR